MEEVKKNLKEWIPSPQAESQSLLSHEAIRPISRREYQKLHADYEVTTIPGVVVSVIKSPYKLKWLARTICGGQPAGDPRDGGWT